MLFGVVAILGIDQWDILGDLATTLFANRLLNTAWWTAPLGILPDTSSPAAFATARAVLFVFAVGIVMNACISYRFRHAPLTLLASRIELLFKNGGKETTIRRTLRIRANRPGVTAYFAQMSVDKNDASFADGSFTARLINKVDGDKNKVKLHKIGSNRSVDILVNFDNPLPHSWLLPFIPSFILRFERKHLPGFLRKYVTELVVEATTENEYDGVNNRYQVRSTRYNHQSVEIELDFSADSWRPADAAAIMVVRRLSNAVFEKAAEKHSSKDHCYRVEVDGLERDEILSVAWTRPPSPRAP